MKRVIKNRPEQEVITWHDANTNKFYAVKSGCGGFGFVTREDYQCKNFIVQCCTELTQGNAWLNYKSNMLPELIKKLVNDDFIVYEFETWQEMFVWIAEEGKKKD